MTDGVLVEKSGVKWYFYYITIFCHSVLDTESTH